MRETVQMTAEDHKEALTQVARMEKAIATERLKLKDHPKGSDEYLQVRSEVARLTHQVATFRKQVDHLVSGKATKDDEKAFIETVVKWTAENRQKSEARMERLCKEVIGETMVVVISDEDKPPAWQFYMAHAYGDCEASKHLLSETRKIGALYQEHAPEVPQGEIPPRAFRAALLKVGLQTEGLPFDACDMTVMMLANGLVQEDFTVAEGEDGPLVRLGAEAMRRLGTPSTVTTTVN